MGLGSYCGSDGGRGDCSAFQQQLLQEVAEGQALAGRAWWFARVARHEWRRSGLKLAGTARRSARGGDVVGANATGQDGARWSRTCRWQRRRACRKSTDSRLASAHIDGAVTWVVRSSPRVRVQRQGRPGLETPGRDGAAAVACTALRGHDASQCGQHRPLLASRLNPPQTRPRRSRRTRRR